MGFFSSITGGLFGSPSKGSSQSGGFNMLPASIQNAYKGFGDQINTVLNSGTIPTAFKPTPLSTGEQSAIDKMFGGFTPTAESLNSDLSMLSNPYDKYVIDEINRQAGGDFSILKQAFDNAGQTGSNRSFIGAGDIDIRREGQIGQFKQGQYNKMIDDVLNVLSPNRRADAAGALEAGDYTRGLDLADNTAQIRALQELAKALGILPQAEGGSSERERGARTGLLSGSGGQILGAIGSMFSDRRLKKDIKHIGFENNYPLYEFSYLWNPNKFIGVMADDVEAIMPSAIGEKDGFKTVNYNMIGVEFRRAA